MHDIWYVALRQITHTIRLVRIEYPYQPISQPASQPASQHTLALPKINNLFIFLPWVHCCMLHHMHTAYILTDLNRSHGVSLSPAYSIFETNFMNTTTLWNARHRLLNTQKYNTKSKIKIIYMKRRNNIYQIECVWDWNINYVPMYESCCRWFFSPFLNLEV